MRDYLAMHQEVDVLLDSHPFSGHTVSCHALCSCPTDLCQDRDIADGVHFLNVRRVHMRKAQILETSSTQIRVIARVQKLAMENALWAPISFSLELDAMSSKVKGYKPNLLGKPKFEDVWLES